MEVDVGKLPVPLAGWEVLGACRLGVCVEAEKRTPFPLLEEE